MSHLLENCNIVPLSFSNMWQAFQAGADIFPAKKVEIAVSYGISLLPAPIRHFIVKRTASAELETLKYFMLRDKKNDKVLGVTGRYSFKDTPEEAWLGWFGI